MAIWKKLIFPTIIRIIALLLIFLYLPFIFFNYGGISQEGGLNSAGPMLMALFVSFKMGIIYLILSSITYLIFRKKAKLRWKIEAGIIILFLLVSTYIALGVRITSTSA